MNSRRFLPTEVQLAWEVMTCKAMRETYDDDNQPCRYFNKHFGPYLAYDWLKENTNKMPGSANTRQIPVVSNGIRFNIPALCGGCRKAPIMTIGINPNMPSWQLNTEGSSWAYPFFDDIEEYATYYRYQTIYQEKYSLNFIKNYIDQTTAIKATKAGKIKSIRRDENDDGFIIELLYDGDSSSTLIKQPRNAAVLINANKHFNIGDILSGVIKLPVGEKTILTQETVGYYTLFASILKIAAEKLISSGNLPTDAELHTGEDVLLGDMIACASPGWTSQSGGVSDKFREEIAKVCCRERQGLALQFQQTNPAIVVFSGTSAFNMFRQTFNGISFSPDFPTDLSGPFSWLRFTLKNRVMMNVKEGATPTRIVISPHFSYKVNFTPCYAFTMKEWVNFQKQWPSQAAILYAKPNAGQVLIGLDNKNATQAKMGDAWEELVAQFIDPCPMIADIIINEFVNGNISYDDKTKHFKRTDGPCQFCSNQLFEIRTGCEYDKNMVQIDIDLKERIEKAAVKMITG